MRVVLPTLYSTAGGSTKVLLAAASALSRDHEVIVRGPFEGAGSRHGHVMPPTLEGPAAKLAALPRLAAAAVAEGAWLARTRPGLVHVHDELALYAYGPTARLLGIPVIWHIHMREGGRLGRRVRESLCDAKVFISAFMAGPGQRKPTALIRDPVAIPALPPRGARCGPLRLAVIGSLTRNKNQALAVETLAALLRRDVQARLTLHGGDVDPAYAGELRAMVEARGLADVVRFAGYTPLDEALEATDVLLATSRHESQHLAVLEALGAGLPVVATPIPAHREIERLVNTPALAVTEPSADAFAAAALAARGDPGAAAAVEGVYGAERFGTELRAFVARVAEEARR